MSFSPTGSPRFIFYLAFLFFVSFFFDDIRKNERVDLSHKWISKIFVDRSRKKNSEGKFVVRNFSWGQFVRQNSVQPFDFSCMLET